MTGPPDLTAHKEEVAWACRILFLTGQAEFTLGHISVRLQGTDTFLMKPRGLGFDEVAPADVITVDLDGRQVAGIRPAHGELPLHTEIYRIRPDVGAVIHAHPAMGTALAAVKDPLPLVCHDSAFLHDRVRVFDGSAEAVKGWRQGAAVANALGDGAVLLLRNHGTVIAEQDVRWAVITSVILERAVAMALRVRALGPYATIPLETAQALSRAKCRDDLVTEYWDYLVRRCIRMGLAHGMPEPRPAWVPASAVVYRGGHPLLRPREL